MRSSIAMLAGLIALTLTTSCWARPDIPDTNKIKRMVAKEFKTLKTEAQLTKEQQKKLEKIQKDFEREFSKHDKAIKKLKAKANNAAKSRDIKTLRKLQKEMGSVKKMLAEIEDLKKKQLNKVLELLSDEQKARYGGYKIFETAQAKFRQLRLNKEQKKQLRALCDEAVAQVGPDNLLSDNASVQKKARTRILQMLKVKVMAEIIKGKKDGNSLNLEDLSNEMLKSKKAVREVKKRLYSDMLDEFKGAKLVVRQKIQIRKMVNETVDNTLAKAASGKAGLLALQQSRGRLKKNIKDTVLTEQQRSLLQKEAQQDEEEDARKPKTKRV